MKIMNMRPGSWGKLIAFFDVETEDGFIIKGFKLVNGINGPFVGFPSQKGNDDEYYDTVWITESRRESLREELNKMAKEAYEAKEGAIGAVMNDVQPVQESNTPLAPSDEDTQTEDKTVEEPFSQDDLPF